MDGFTTIMMGILVEDTNDKPFVRLNESNNCAELQLDSLIKSLFVLFVSSILQIHTSKVWTRASTLYKYFLHGLVQQKTKTTMIVLY
jgi:hypothetical protein